MKKINFDNFVDSYNKTLQDQTMFFTSDDSYFAEYKVKVAKRVIKNKPKNILEYGCGIGRNIKFLEKYFKIAQIYGSDISKKSLDVASIENPKATFFHTEDENFREVKFDMIFIAGVFHHIEPSMRKKVMIDLKDKLSKGGVIFVFEHNPYNPITKKIVQDCPYDEDAVLLKPRELKCYFYDTGLTSYKQGYALFFPPRFHRLLKFESLLGWLPLGGQYWAYAENHA